MAKTTYYKNNLMSIEPLSKPLKTEDTCGIITNRLAKGLVNGLFISLIIGCFIGVFCSGYIGFAELYTNPKYFEGPTEFVDALGAIFFLFILFGIIFTILTLPISILLGLGVSIVRASTPTTRSTKNSD
ncbi:MAG: hypothetical protein AAF485_22590 [Chloroflexota bacterium]